VHSLGIAVAQAGSKRRQVRGFTFHVHFPYYVRAGLAGMAAIARNLGTRNKNCGDLRLVAGTTSCRADIAHKFRAVGLRQECSKRRLEHFVLSSFQKWA